MKLFLLHNRLIRALLCVAAIGFGVSTGAVANDAIYCKVTIVSSPDSDGDGLSDANEAWLGTNPGVKDTDGDRLEDGEEYGPYGTDPLERDTDQDGMDDGDEVYADTDPNDRDDVFALEAERALPEPPLSGVGPRNGLPVDEGQPVVITWNTSALRWYTLQASTNLVEASAWTNLPGWVDVPGTGGSLFYTNPPAGPYFRHFRCRVREP